MRVEFGRGVVVVGVEVEGEVLRFLDGGGVLVVVGGMVALVRCPLRLLSFFLFYLSVRVLFRAPLGVRFRF